MSPDKREGVRRRLAAERERLGRLRDARQAGVSEQSETASFEELSSEDQHAADAGTETFNRERDLGLSEDLDREIADVDAALERLGQGRYGVCVACGRSIAPERLEAVPATAFCLDDAQLASIEARRQR